MRSIAFGRGELGDGLALGVEPEPGAALAGGRHPGVGDGGFHDLSPLCNHCATRSLCDAQG